MLPVNLNVKNGEANGTQAVVEEVVLKSGEHTRESRVYGNVKLKCVTASQVSHIVLRHLNERLQPALFKVTPKQYTFKAKVLKPTSMRAKPNDREVLQMKGTQLPILVNNATTGHKLQGSGVENLFVHSWSYVTNWVYVMLSRVKTLDGLFLRHPLSMDLRNYSMSPELSDMIDGFRVNYSPSYWSDEQYEQLFGRLG
jgi:hypothetical protein